VVQSLAVGFERVGPSIQSVRGKIKIKKYRHEEHDGS
jgi:hypothetical protein